MDFVSSSRAAENSQDGKRLLGTHMWCPDGLPWLYGIEQNSVDPLGRSTRLGCFEHILPTQQFQPGLYDWPEYSFTCIPLSWTFLKTLTSMH